MADEEHADRSSGRDTTNISAGNIAVTNGMVAVGSDITQIYNADPDAPYKVAGLTNPYLQGAATKLTSPPLTRSSIRLGGLV